MGKTITGEEIIKIKKETVLETSYNQLSDMIYYKIYKDFEQQKLNHDEFIKITRGLSSVFNYLDTKEA